MFCCHINNNTKSSCLSTQMMANNCEIYNLEFNECGAKEVRKYEERINYNCGMTEHYERRVARENELNKLIGEGESLAAFYVDKGSGDLQIHEIISNGIIIVYSFYTHKLITIFAPPPERIIALYFSVGEFPSSTLIEKSKMNERNGYSFIYYEH